MVQEQASVSQQESVITDEMRNLIGKELGVTSEQVERGAIRRFVEAVEDTNPLYVDEVYARGTEYGGVVAPPTFLCTIKFRGQNRRPLAYTRPPAYKRGFHAADEWEFCEPVRPGDTITMRETVADFYEKQGQKTPLLFHVRMKEYYNQLGQLVGRLRISGVQFP